LLAVTDTGSASNLSILTNNGNVSFAGTIDSASQIINRGILDISSESIFSQIENDPDNSGFGKIDVSSLGYETFFQNEDAFGRFSDETIYIDFELANTAVDLNFNFFAIDSWDGNEDKEYFKVSVKADDGSYVLLDTLQPVWSGGPTGTP
jgi:hypothetical protein